jgi:3-deoxy-D-manno-octulosonic-acid transferase
MLYDLFLFIALIFLSPFWLWKILFKKKKQKELLRKLGFRQYLPLPPQNKFVIWIHAVSVGETKACQKLIDEIKQKRGDAFIVISSTTYTGHEEAKKSLKANSFVYLPFDFSWSVKRALNAFKPKLVIFIETDLWFHFLKYAKQMGAKTALVSGKMSEKSSRRYKKFSFFSKKLFSLFDVIGVQNEPYQDLFIQAGADKRKIFITGNLKWDNKPIFIDENAKIVWKNRLGLENQKAIVLASTHDNEEISLLEALVPLIKKDPQIKLLIAPRHPERFKSVYHQLQKKNFSCSLLSQNNSRSSIIILDQMGILNSIYQIVDLAIVGGSFVPIGGHNILEPIFYKTPVFFGPYMHAQKEMKKVVLAYEAGDEAHLNNLSQKVEEYFNNRDHQNKFEKGCTNLTNNLPESLHKTWELLNNLDI